MQSFGSVLPAPPQTPGQENTACLKTRSPRLCRGEGVNAVSDHAAFSCFCE